MKMVPELLTILMPSAAIDVEYPFPESFILEVLWLLVVMSTLPPVIVKDPAPTLSADSVPVVILFAEMFPMVKVPACRSMLHPLFVIVPVNFDTLILFAAILDADSVPAVMLSAVIPLVTSDPAILPEVAVTEPEIFTSDA